MMHRLDLIGDRELRETLLFARAQPMPVTADDLAAAQQIHRNVARSRLERLAEAGLLVPSFERRTGRTGPGLPGGSRADGDRVPGTPLRAIDRPGCRRPARTRALRAPARDRRRVRSRFRPRGATSFREDVPN